MSILNRAEMLLQAKNYSGSGAWLDESGNGHNATNNGALFKPYDGTRYIHVPDGIANAMSVPANAAYEDTDVDVRARVAFQNITTEAHTVISQGVYQTDGWRLYVNSTHLQFAIYGAGAGQQTVCQATLAAAGITDTDVPYWIRGTHDSATGAMALYVSSDGVDWGSAIATASSSGNTPVVATGDPIIIGAANLASAFDKHIGDFYEAQLYVDGVLELDVRASDASEPFASFAERSSNAATVTINRSSSGLVSTVVDRAMFLLTTNDYLEIADDAALDFSGSEALTVLAVVRPSTVAAGQDIAVAKKDNLTTSAGWALGRSTAASQFIIADGTADDDDTAGTMTANTLYTLAGVRNVTDDDIEAFLSGTGSGTPTTDSTTATLANALPVRIGATSNTAANFWEGQIIAVALFREALTPSEVSQVGNLLVNGGAEDFVVTFAPLAAW